MFNPKEYWKRRKAGLPGTEKPAVKVHEAGETVPYVNRKGEDAEYPNKAGKRVAMTKTGPVPMNRKVARANGDINRPTKAKATPKPDGKKSNHERLIERRAKRG